MSHSLSFKILIYPEKAWLRSQIQPIAPAPLIHSAPEYSPQNASAAVAALYTQADRILGGDRQNCGRGSVGRGPDLYRSGQSPGEGGPLVPEPVSSDDLWAEVDAARESGELAKAIAQNRNVYQCSPDMPGYLQAIYPDGTR